MDSELELLSTDALELAVAEDQVEKARAARDARIVHLALTSDFTYEQIGEAANGLSVTMVYKIAKAAGIRRQRVQVHQPAAT